MSSVSKVAGHSGNPVKHSPFRREITRWECVGKQPRWLARPDSNSHWIWQGAYQTDDPVRPRARWAPTMSHSRPARSVPEKIRRLLKRNSPPFDFDLDRRLATMEQLLHCGKTHAAPI